EKVVMLKRHRALVIKDESGRSMHMFNPASQLIGVANGCGESDQSHVSRRVDYRFFPDRPSTWIAKVVQFVEYHAAYRRELFIQRGLACQLGHITCGDDVGALLLGPIIRSASLRYLAGDFGRRPTHPLWWRRTGGSAALKQHVAVDLGGHNYDRSAGV